MSEIDDACQAFARQLGDPWNTHLSGQEKVWMLTYRPDSERRLRHRLPMFRTVTEASQRQWQLIDITNSFEDWLEKHEYRDEYLRDPEAIQFGALDQFADHLIEDVATQLRRGDSDTVSALLGSASLFGLLRVSQLLHGIAKDVPGRLLVFFPGTRQDNNYRLLDGHDGWSYLAVPIN
jgi:hypothetical protein